MQRWAHNQFKHYMDKVKWKSPLWLEVMARCLQFVSLPLIDEECLFRKNAKKQREGI